MKHWWLPTTHLPPHILTICGTICGSNFLGGEKLMNIFKSEIKGSKESVVATHHTFTTTYFDNMWDNMRVKFFWGGKN